MIRISQTDKGAVEHADSCMARNVCVAPQRLGVIENVPFEPQSMPTALPVLTCLDCLILDDKSTTHTERPAQHTFIQCWFDVGPASQTLDRHQSNIGPTACWDIGL